MASTEVDWLTGVLLSKADPAIFSMMSLHMPNSDDQDSLAALAKMSTIPTVLRLVKEATGLRFAAVARVTAKRWIAYAVDDSAHLDIHPGDERPLASTLCNEVRLRRKSLACGDGMAALAEVGFAAEVQLELDVLQSHISVPIITAAGLFVGTLCGLDPAPVKVEHSSVIETLELFAQLIATHLDVHAKLDESQSELGVSVETGRLREEFVAVLGHDLRTPLGAVRLSAELLQPRVADDRSKALVGAIHTSALRMGALIDDVLDFARCRLGSQFDVRMHRVDNLFEALEPVIAEMRSAHPAARIDYAYKGALPVLCDFGRISQLISNLLSNAVHHGAAGGLITISGAAQGQELVVSVANEGKPIPKHQLNLLFRPFTRAEGHKNRGGLGLGLYICSQIAESHSGSLQVTSDNEKTAFTLRLPALPRSGHAP